MNKRTLGRTGLEVSEIGFGAWGIGGAQWIGATEDESLRALHRAVDLGLNFVDTALAYGKGESERIIGRLLKDRRDAEILVATKIPPKNLVWPASPEVPVSAVFPAEHIARMCEKSLENLDVERIDLLQLHVWHDRFLDQDGWRDAFLGLKKAGKVRFLGISVSEHDADSALRAASSGLFDAMQILYNVFDQRPAERLLPLCREHGVGVLARVPFDEGGLTGTITPTTTFPDGDFRTDYFGGRPPAPGVGAGRGSEDAPGRRGQDPARAGSALLSQPRRRDHRDPRDAEDEPRPRELRGRRRPPTVPRAPGRPEAPRLAAEFLQRS